MKIKGLVNSCFYWVAGEDVIPAKAGISVGIPAFAGMTLLLDVLYWNKKSYPLIRTINIFY